MEDVTTTSPTNLQGSSAGRWSEFLRGALRPNPLSLFIALGINLALLVIVGVAVTPEAIAKHYRYLMSDGFDRYSRVTGETLALQAKGRASASVVILGASTTLRCITSEHDLERMVRESSGLVIDAHNFCTDAQSTWEMAAIVDRLPQAFDGVLVIGVTPGLLSFGTGIGEREQFASLNSLLTSSRLGFAADAMDEEARRVGLPVPFRTGIYAVDNREFLLARRRIVLRNLLRGVPKFEDPLTAPWISYVNRPEFWQEEIAKMPALVERYRRNQGVTLPVIERMMRNLARRGRVAFLLLVSPIHPGWYKEPVGAEFYAAYLVELKDFAERNQMSFMNIAADAELVAADFVDYEGHIGNAAARDRCMRVLADRVSTLLTPTRGAP